MDHASIIRALGDYHVVGPALGLDATTASRWKRAGIPSRHWNALLKLPEAKANGVTWEHLDAGRPQTAEVAS